MTATTHRVVLSVRGDFIPLSRFAAAASDLLALLEQLDASIAGRPSLAWGVTGLRLESPAVLETSPRPLDEETADYSSEVITAFVEGMEEIRKHSVRPRFFTDDALIRARRLAEIADGDIDRVTVMGTVSGRLSAPIVLTRHVAAHVDELIGPVGGVSLGSIEGTLELVSIHRGIFFHVYDVITRQRVRCDCEREVLNDLAQALGKRVLVYGPIRLNAKGQPISIKVERYRVLRDRDQLPQTRDLRGLLSKTKSPGDLSEYLRGD